MNERICTSVYFQKEKEILSLRFVLITVLQRLGYGFALKLNF